MHYNELKLCIIFCTAVILAFLPHTSSGKTLAVPRNYPTIQSAINAARNSDTVIVAEGIYKENIRFNGKGIVVTSTFFITHDWMTVSRTIIDGSHAINKDTGSTVQFLDKEDSTAILDGFTITGGTGTRYLFPYGTGTNKVQEGAGIILHYSSAIIRNNIITLNTIRPQDSVIAGGGGGIASMYGNPTIDHNAIFSNIAGYAGGIVLNWSRGTVKNNIIYHNTGTGKWGCGGIMVWQAPQHGGIVENNTIIGNKSDSARSGGIEISVKDSTTIPLVKNNIVWGNRQAKGKQITNAKYIENNNVEDYAERTNISQDPKFAEQSFRATASLGMQYSALGAFGGSGSIIFPLFNVEDIYLSTKTINDTAEVGRTAPRKIEILNTSSRKIHIDSVSSTHGYFLLSNNFRERTLHPFEKDTLVISLINPSVGMYIDTIKIYHSINGVLHPLRIPVTLHRTNTKRTESLLPGKDIPLRNAAAAVPPVHSNLKGLTIIGDPALENGARWTYKDTIDAIEYDLTGILLVPPGPGPFPAVILSHGGGDNVSGAPMIWAKAMVKWGCVCIAANYTFSSGTPLGAPGKPGQKNTRTMNILRAHACRDIAANLLCVDTNRVAAHGFSMGAYVTDGLVGTYPLQFKAASHAGGGIGTAASSTQLRQTRNIVTPFQMHHGMQDTIIPIADDIRFDSLLQVNGVSRQLFSYPNYGHMELMQDSLMLERIRAWYAHCGLFEVMPVYSSGQKQKQ